MNFTEIIFSKHGIVSLCSIYKDFICKILQVVYKFHRWTWIQIQISKFRCRHVGHMWAGCVNFPQTVAFWSAQSVEPVELFILPQNKCQGLDSFA